MGAVLIALFAAATGAVIGSFVALVADRWPRGEDWIARPSHCRACGAALRPHELVPIASFLIQCGRCRRCGAAIPPDCLLAETAGAAIALVIAAKAESVAAALAWGGFGGALLLLALIDARHLWLPDAITLPLGAAGLLAGQGALAWCADAALADRLAGAAIGYGALEGLRRGWRWAAGREALGGGDPKLLGAIGAWLGWQALPAIVLAGALGGLGWAAIVALAGRWRGRETQLPLGTMLALAALGWLAVAPA